MKLGKLAIASIDEITEDTVNQMVKDGDLSKDRAELLLKIFREILSEGDTELLALLAVALMSSLDDEQNQFALDALLVRDPMLSKQNTLNYMVLNKVENGLNS